MLVMSFLLKIMVVTVSLGIRLFVSTKTSWFTHLSWILHEELSDFFGEGTTNQHTIKLQDVLPWCIHT